MEEDQIPELLIGMTYDVKFPSGKVLRLKCLEKHYRYFDHEFGYTFIDNNKTKIKFTNKIISSNRITFTLVMIIPQVEKFKINTTPLPSEHKEFS